MSDARLPVPVERWEQVRNEGTVAHDAEMACADDASSLMRMNTSHGSSFKLLKLTYNWKRNV